MGGFLLLLAWTTSAVPLVLSNWTELGPGARPHLGLVLLPWMALAGLPRARAAEPGNGTVAMLFLAAPLVALALALDRAEPGAPTSGNALAVLAGALFAVGLSRAAVRAGDVSRMHGALWVGLVLGAPMLGLLVGSFAEPGSAAGGDALGTAGVLASLSPLGYCLRLATEASAGLAPAGLAGAAGSVFALLAAAEWDRRRT